MPPHWGVGLPHMDLGEDGSILPITGSYCRVSSTKKINAKVCHPPFSQHLTVSFFPNPILDTFHRNSSGTQNEACLRKLGDPLDAALAVHANLCFLHSAEIGAFQLKKFNDFSCKVFLWSYFCDF